METQSVNCNLLVEELQLGEQLNHCVHSERRADFALMLSMLTDDVLAHSQFKLPHTDNSPAKTSEDTLRKTFELPKKQRLALENMEQINEFSQAKLIEQQQLSTLHLTQALTPQPLAFRDDKTHISATVLSNTRLYCQQQHQLKKQTESTQDKENRLAFNVNEWLKSVQTAIVKAPLLATTA
ncbi:VC2046/SO_2500 family protein [Colwellia sp. 1_MG-2023]|uniref:VC2046/SO_2500 family protein n=1 Tax=Colwellia sp. 1_MG-2023 TaxID=3062649 RepID=UPI0026E425BB|nr:VC2046/SO_2500 family protein [Colwellia sp. 1_MG-2023]MDO6446823.1 VC2046/SO_2500 family protein [Colwellia sp. 1_MG-2023]